MTGLRFTQSNPEDPPMALAALRTPALGQPVTDRARDTEELSELDDLTLELEAITLLDAIQWSATWGDPMRKLDEQVDAALRMGLSPSVIDQARRGGAAGGR
jgi:hypothetical protein